MSIRIHSHGEFHRREPKVHGVLYELFHDSRFWAVAILVLVAIGTYLAAKFLANTLSGSFSYQPSFNP